ncbi:hypothetical protein IEO21_03458 [Rhodonia placenta]|uniref:Uncharacterized protein n=1 Tax=Rhodonia placenta TaxID=104341 RepID=A0A8H7P5U0_9APHY|nr:hypothetical protein IEO21_03458 [Postia placenta]
MSGNPSCDLPTSTKLHRLQELARSWRDMRFPPGICFPVASGVYAFSAGVFAQVNSTRVSREERRWTVKPTGIVGLIVGICLDPSQDLLIVAEQPRLSQASSQWKFHFLSLTGPGTPHPLASEPFLSYAPSYCVRVLSLHIEGDIFGIFMISTRHIWYWKSPSVQLDVSGVCLVGCNPPVMLSS